MTKRWGGEHLTTPDAKQNLSSNYPQGFEINVTYYNQWLHFVAKLVISGFLQLTRPRGGPGKTFSGAHQEDLISCALTTSFVLSHCLDIRIDQYKAAKPKLASWLSVLLDHTQHRM